MCRLLPTGSCDPVSDEPNNHFTAIVPCAPTPVGMATSVGTTEESSFRAGELKRLAYQTAYQTLMAKTSSSVLGGRKPVNRLSFDVEALSSRRQQHFSESNNVVRQSLDMDRRKSPSYAVLLRAGSGSQCGRTSRSSSKNGGRVTDLERLSHVMQLITKGRLVCMAPVGRSVCVDGPCGQV